MKTSPQSFQREQDETVWHTRKQKQETERDIQLMKNRLKLLNRGDAQLSKQIEETKKKTKSMIELKMNHHAMIEQKKQNQKDDEASLKEKQKANYSLKKQQEDELTMIKKAMKQIKLDEYKRIKDLSTKNAEIINQQKSEHCKQNQIKREHIKEIMHKSKSNISMYWNEKLSFIQKENEKTKLDNRRAADYNRSLQEKMTMEEKYMIQKLSQSKDVQEKLRLKLQRAQNLQHNEFTLMIEEEKMDNIKSTKSADVPRWLPTPEKEPLQSLETEPKKEEEPEQ